MKLTHVVTALALGAAGCMGMEDEASEQRYALGGESNLERIDPAAQELSTEMVSMDLTGRTALFIQGVAPELVPEPRPEITDADVEYYEVEGDTCEEVKDDIFNTRTGKGFLEGGRRYGGQTNMQLSYDCDVNAQPQPREERKEYCCKAVFENIDGYCNAAVHLPQWDGSDECWDRFIDGLITHEQGHVGVCHDYAGRLEAALSGLESTKCSEESMAKACGDAMADLGQKADNAEARINRGHGAAQDAYDAETSHGETQGAVLNCDCE